MKQTKVRSKWLSVVLPIFITLGFRIWGLLLYIILYFIFRKKERDFANTMLLSASATIVFLIIMYTILGFSFL